MFMKDHKVVCLAEMTREDLEFMLTRENTCEYHSKQVYEFYCKDCDRRICVKCFQTQDWGHDISKLEDYNLINKATTLMEI